MMVKQYHQLLHEVASKKESADLPAIASSDEAGGYADYPVTISLTYPMEWIDEKDLCILQKIQRSNLFT